MYYFEILVKIFEKENKENYKDESLTIQNIIVKKEKQVTIG